MKKILVIGSNNRGSLEQSYFRSIKKVYPSTSFFDYKKETLPFIRGGKIGKLIHSFLPVEQWNRKMNKILIIEVKQQQPDVLFFFAKASILYGTLACIKTIFPKIKIVWIWPDTPMNLENCNLQNAPFIDYLGTYSSSSVDVFKKLGYSLVDFLPLGSDKGMHLISTLPIQYDWDIGFVGGWRPEREAVMQKIVDNFGHLKIAIHGPNWKKMLKGSVLVSRVISSGLYEDELASFFNRTRININVIDDTNYPAANMRFFEIPISCSLQLASKCPEMESEFVDNQDIVYFEDTDELLAKVEYLVENPKICQNIALSGYTKTLEKHTYDVRVHQVFSYL